jgi:outer membrane protein insertion porin family
LELRKEIDELLDRLFFVGGLEGKWVTTWTSANPIIDGRRIFSPRRIIARIFNEATLNRLNSPLNPSQGFLVKLRPEWVTGSANRNAVEDSFFRLQLTASYYLNFWETITFGQGIRLGQVIPLFDRESIVPPDERFYLGGVASLRGFPEDSVGLRENQTQEPGGEFIINYNAELRYPLIKEYGIWGATFVDLGVLADCRVDEDLTQRQGCYQDAFPAGETLGKLRASAGLGLRYLIADQIPIVLDYGVLLNRRPGEGFGALQFNLSYAF